MRIRSIKPEFYRSLDIAALDWDARLVFIGLWSYVDDNGVGRDVEQLITADLFPLDGDPTETLRRVSLGLDALFRRGLITRYEVDGKRYLFVTNWDRHQLVKNPNKPRYPRPTTDYGDPTESLLRPYGDPTETLPPGTGEQGNRGTGEQINYILTDVVEHAADETTKTKRGTRLPADFIPSENSRQTITAEAPTLDLRREHARFCDHWQAQPGQKGVKLDWDATWRNWMRRAADDARRNGTNGKSRRQQETDDLFARAMARAQAADAAEAAGLTIRGEIIA